MEAAMGVVRKGLYAAPDDDAGFGIGREGGAREKEREELVEEKEEQERKRRRR